MILLGSARAEQRLAAFLLDLSWRYAARGYSGTSFRLRMTREDIGLHLGLTIESVSRLLAGFRHNGWIDLRHRDIDICDRTSLEALAAGMSPPAARVRMTELERIVPIAALAPRNLPALTA